MVNHRGSVATCSSLPSVKDFRKSRVGGSARRPSASCKRWRRPCRQRAPCLSLKPGARLVREWRGRTHTVTVMEDGFAYGGASYPSLTKIAKIGLRRSGALTCFEFVRDHGIAHASRKAARGAFHLVALAGFLSVTSARQRPLSTLAKSTSLRRIGILYAGNFTPRAEHMAGWGLDYFKLCHEAPLNQPSSGAP